MEKETLQTALEKEPAGTCQNDMQPFYWKNELNLLLIAEYSLHCEKFLSVRHKGKQVWGLITNDLTKELRQKLFE